MEPDRTRVTALDGAIGKVKPVIVAMQTNHSFDDYFGALACAPRGPYHNPDRTAGATYVVGDPLCVDGPSCTVGAVSQVIPRGAHRPAQARYVVC